MPGEQKLGQDQAADPEQSQSKSQYSRPEIDIACEIVSETIGPEVSAAEVAEFIDKSQVLGLLFHGVRDFKKIEEVRTKGVQPITGGQSFWTSGRSLLFAKPPTPDSTTLEWARTSTFFNYAWSRDDQGLPLMALAVTNLVSLAEAGIQPRDYEPAGETRLDHPVDASLLSYFIVQSETPEQTRVKTFDALLEAVRNKTILEAGTRIIK